VVECPALRSRPRLYHGITHASLVCGGGKENAVIRSGSSANLPGEKEERKANPCAQLIKHYAVETCRVVEV
jgi:hypothetical protein